MLILDGIQAVASADLQQAASAALAGTSPEEFLGAAGCSSPGAAAALLVAGLIALKAGQRGSSRCSSPYLQRIGSGSLGASPVSGAERPGASTAGSPAVLRARPTSAPCKGKGGQRPASPAVGATQGACFAACSSLLGPPILKDIASAVAATINCAGLGPSHHGASLLSLPAACCAVVPYREAAAVPRQGPWGPQLAGSACTSSAPRSCLSSAVLR